MKDTWKLDATEVCQSDKCCFHQHFSPDLKIKVLWFPLLVKLVLTRVYFKKQKVILLERFSKLASYSKMISQIYISCPKNVLPLLFAKTKLGFNKHFSSLSDTHVPGTHVHHIVWFFFIASITCKKTLWDIFFTHRMAVKAEHCQRKTWLSWHNALGQVRLVTSSRRSFPSLELLKEEAAVMLTKTPRKYIRRLGAIFCLLLLALCFY